MLIYNEFNQIIIIIIYLLLKILILLNDILYKFLNNGLKSWYKENLTIISRTIENKIKKKIKYIAQSWE